MDLVFKSLTPDLCTVSYALRDKEPVGTHSAFENTGSNLRATSNLFRAKVAPCSGMNKRNSPLRSTIKRVLLMIWSFLRFLLALFLLLRTPKPSRTLTKLGQGPWSVPQW